MGGAARERVSGGPSGRDGSGRQPGPEPGSVLYGYLGSGGSPDQSHDAIVVHSRTRMPAVVRTFHLGPVDGCLFVGGDVDVSPHHQVPAGDGLVVGYVVAGLVSISQQGHTVELEPGAFAFYDGTSRYRVRSPGPHRYLVVRVHLQRVGLQHLAGGPLLAADVSAHPSAPLLSALLGTIAGQESAPSPAAAQHIGDAVAACVNAVIADTDLRAPTDRSLSLFHQLTGWLDDHLTDEHPSARALADSQFLSARYIRKVFAEHGTTVSAYVRRRRLQMIRNDLLDPRHDQVKVSVIAARWGFRDPSVFSRAFHSEFGDSPQRYRRRHGGRDGVQ